MPENLHRRQFLRAAVLLPVKSSVEGAAPGGTQQGEVVDLGEGGMRLVSRAHAPARSTIRVSFTLPASNHEVRARGRVVLSFYAAPEDRYHHGVAFTSIDREDREAIGQFVTDQTATHP